MPRAELAIPKEKNCKNCGKRFTSYRQNELYCSDECRRSRRNTVNRARYHENIELSRAKFRESKKRMREKRLGIVDPNASQGNGKGYYAEPREVSCAFCGTPFIATRINQKYCSEPCRKAVTAIAADKYYKANKEHSNAVRLQYYYKHKAETVLNESTNKQNLDK